MKSGVKKITVSSLKMVLSTLPLNRGQVVDIKSKLAGYDFPSLQDRVVLIPDTVRIPIHLPAEYHGAYSVLDIIEYSTTDVPGDRDNNFVRFVLFEGSAEFSEGAKTPPLRALIERKEDGQEVPLIEFIDGAFYDELLEGIADAIRGMTDGIRRTLDSAAAQAYEQLQLQQSI